MDDDKLKRDFVPPMDEDLPGLEVKELHRAFRTPGKIFLPTLNLDGSIGGRPKGDRTIGSSAMSEDIFEDRRPVDRCFSSAMSTSRSDNSDLESSSPLRGSTSHEVGSSGYTPSSYTPKGDQTLDQQPTEEMLHSSEAILDPPRRMKKPTTEKSPREKNKEILIAAMIPFYKNVLEEKPYYFISNTNTGGLTWIVFKETRHVYPCAYDPFATDHKDPNGIYYINYESSFSPPNGHRGAVLRVKFSRKNHKHKFRFEERDGLYYDIRHEATAGGSFERYNAALLVAMYGSNTYGEAVYCAKIINRFCSYGLNLLKPVMAMDEDERKHILWLLNRKIERCELHKTKENEYKTKAYKSIMKRVFGLSI